MKLFHRIPNIEFYKRRTLILELIFIQHGAYYRPKLSSICLLNVENIKSHFEIKSFCIESMFKICLFSLQWLN